MRYQTNDMSTAFAHQFGHRQQQIEHGQKETISAHIAETKQSQTISSAEEKFTPEMTWQRDVADSLRSQLQEKRAEEDSSPLMVSLVGLPGSGKSTSCHMLKDLLSDVGCMILPFDGYHYPMEYLKSLPDANDRIYRRGAPDTFDVDSLRTDLERIKDSDETDISLPDFDHATADPQHDVHTFCRDSTEILLCEGLYLLAEHDGFAPVKEIFDLSIFMDADVDVCVDRLKRRNTCIPGYTPEEIELRVEQVDRENANIVAKTKKNAQIVVNA